MGNNEIAATKQRKWNVPSWRNKDSYLFADSLGKAKLRWECLRRLPAYRRAWENFGNSRGGFSLPKMIDPAISSDNLTALQESQLYSFEARPLGDLIAPPPAGSLLTSADGLPHRYGGAEDIGIGVLNLVESGYVLIALNPMSSATRQARAIETMLSAMQLEIREDSDEFAPHRINEPKVDAPTNLLRVMDAFDQEGILDKGSRRGGLTEIGKEIFLATKVAHSTPWHKVAQQSYKLAEQVARWPVAMNPAIKLTQ